MADLPWHLVLDDIGKRSESLKRKKTKADCIRSMTDEELEEWLIKLICSSAPQYADSIASMYKGRLLDWLKQDAEESET